MQASLRSGAVLIGCGVLFLTSAFCSAQAPSPQPGRQASCSLSGAVVDVHGSPVREAAITLREPGGGSRKLITDRSGGFRVAPLPCGRYKLRAQKPGLQSSESTIALSADVPATTRLVLQPADSPEAAGNRPPHDASSPSQGIEFSDKPNFAVAGVTDWTAVGGHGSDAVLRASEDLSRETARLGTEAKPDLPTSANEAKLRSALLASPASYSANRDLGEFYLHAGRFTEALPALEAAASLPQATATDEYDLALACQGVGDLTRAQQHAQAALVRGDAAEFHGLAGALAEKLGNPLAAVKQLQRAAQLDPSEANYLAWGAELLVHRAVWQATDVFENGSKLHPASARLKSAWGAALFAGARYDAASTELCEAATLDPTSTEPYVFMGKMTLTSAPLLPCELQALARFAQGQPTNAEANFFYAMALLKQGDAPDAQRGEDLLRKAVALDPKYSAAFVQLGVLASGRRQYAEAVRDFEKAVEADPQQAEAHYRLGVAYNRTGDKTRAAQQFQLHNELDKAQAEAVEQQRKQVKQFSVVLGNKGATPEAQP